MALNMAALNKIQKGMDEEAGGGNLFFPQKKIGAETSIRILPPLPILNGMYFRPAVKWWINKKPYQSLETFGEECPITAYIAEMTEKLAKKENPELHALLSNKRLLKKSREFYMPILLLDDDGKPSGPAKVFQCGPVVMREINKIITHRFNQNDTENGPLDRKLGKNIMLSKTGEELNTEYKAMAWPEAAVMPKEYYQTDKIPNVHEIIEKQRKSEEYLLSVIKNYFHGTPILEEDGDEDDDAPRAKKSTTVVKGKATSAGTSKRDPVADMARMAQVDEDDEDDAPKAKKKAAPADDDDEDDDAPKPKKKAAPVDDDDDEDTAKDDDEDDDDEPVKPKKKAAPVDDDDEDEDDAPKKPAKKAAPVDDDDDDDDEADAKPKKKAAAASTPAKSATKPKGGKGKSDIADLDDE